MSTPIAAPPSETPPASPSPPRLSLPVVLGRVVLAVLVGWLVIWSFAALLPQFHPTPNGAAHGLDIIHHLFPHSRADWSYSLKLWPDLVRPFIETVQMDVVGTILGTLVAFPISFLAARTGALPSALTVTIKTLLNMALAVPTLVYALLAIPVVGLGPQAGALAIAVVTFISLARLYAEALESVAVGPIEAVRASGGNAAQVFIYGMLPQVFPLYLSTTMYSLEYNLKDSFIVGIVGAGGLGFELQNAINLFKWLDAGFIIALIIILVNFVDYLSFRVRRVFS